jgi:hypothetical protein
MPSGERDADVGALEQWFMEQPPDFRAALNRRVTEEYEAGGRGVMRFVIQRRHIAAARRARAGEERADAH